MSSMRCFGINAHYLILYKQIDQVVRKLPLQAVLNRQVYILCLHFGFLGLWRLVVLLFLFTFFSLKTTQTS